MVCRPTFTGFFASTTSFLVASFLTTGDAISAPSVGQKAPEIALTDTSGKPVKLSDFKGKHVVLEWNNPGCPYVRKHYDSANMQALQKEVGGKGVAWLAINSTADSHPDYLAPAQMGRWMAQQKAVPTATLMDEDGAVGKAYGARTTPHMYMVDPKGVLIYAGGIDSNPSYSQEGIKTATNYVRQGVNEALAGKALSKPVTAPYGCSVKYKVSPA
jgi:peroxiredoxin